MSGKGALAAALFLGVLAGAGCGASRQAVKAPFAAGGGIEAGPSSGLWGDGSSGPTGMHLGCIEGRRFALLITVRNRTEQTIDLLGGGGTQRESPVIERVAVQVRLAPPPPRGDAVISGLRAWVRRNSSSVEIPAGRDAWVQSNFLMRNCRYIRQPAVLTVNRGITLTYSVRGRRGTQSLTVRSARILLSRGPLHPSLPINHAG